jgi:predicted amidohydrolase
VKVAAYQAPLLAAGSMDALSFIRARVEWCEVSFGSSAIVNPDGLVVKSARQLREDLVVAEIDTVPHG